MALAYRAYYSFINQPLITSKGEHTSAIYGFTTFLMRILENEKPDFLAVAFDTQKPNFRHKLYEPYKANRFKMPDEMISQILPLKELIRAFSIPILELDGYEADDVIGTISLHAERENIESFLVTSDKDFVQLVSPLTKLYKPGRQGTEIEIIDLDNVKERYGIEPERFIDFLALVGDKSDNVPGVPGIGEKTAFPLLQQFGTLENVLANAESIPQKGTREKIQKNKDLALLSKRLVTIDRQVPLGVEIEELKVKEADIEKVLVLFERFEFRSLIYKLRQKIQTSFPLPPQLAVTEEFPKQQISLTEITSDNHAYHLLEDLDQVEQLARRLKSAKEFVFDTETTSVSALEADLVGISISLGEREAYYIPVATESIPEHKEPATVDLFAQHVPAPASGGFDVKKVIKLLKPTFEDEHITKIGQNVKYDMLVLSRYGIDVRGNIFDTMIAGFILQGEGKHNLDALAKQYLNYKTVSFSDLVGAGRDVKDIRTIPLRSVADYSCEDADITYRLKNILKTKLEAEQLLKLCEDLEFPLAGVLARMEQLGVCIDVPFLESLSKEFDGLLINLGNEIIRLAGYDFNINSTQQLSDVLFKKLGLPPVRKTKTGFSTDVSVLEELRNQHPIIEQLLNYRQFSKLKSTYVDALPKLMNPATKRVHTSFNQTIASTGRLSSSDPNLQNIPIRTEYGRSIRKAFIAASADKTILSADYSQIELRVMAHISADEGLREAFKNNEDIHLTTAAKVFGVKHEEVSRDMRRKAKEVNFGIMYGIGAFGLAARLDINQSEARGIIDRYFERFPKVKQYIQDTIETARGRGYVETLLGRRRYIPDLKSQNRNIRQAAERQAINMPIQGTAADLIKLAMIQIDKHIRNEEFETRMILQVHDELVFEAVKKEMPRISDIIVGEMATALKLDVPIVVDMGQGENWFVAH
jgi:DNA polymerase-1